MKLAIDMDGVMADFVGGILRWRKILYPWYDDITAENVTSYNFSDILKYGQLMKIMSMPNFFYNLDVIPGAIECLSKLHGDGHKLSFITKLPVYHEGNFLYDSIIGNSASDKYRWFNKYIVAHIPGITQKDLIFCFDKSWIAGRFDIMLDDDTRNLELFDGLRVLFGTSYNKEYVDAFRVGSVNQKNAMPWKEFYSFVSRMRGTRLYDNRSN